MYDACLAWTANVTGPVFADNADPEPKAMRSFGGAAMYNLYETADHECLILGGSEVKFARNLLEALGRLDLLAYAKEEPGPAQEPLRQFFRATFARETLAHWQAFLRDVDCCWSWVRSLKESFEDPLTKERGMVFEDAEGHRHIGPPMRFRHEPPAPKTALPGYGEHGEALASEAGLDAETIAGLRSKGVI
jgi:crotonobetainyl-CoA:carnitine CoA-transferase CaiB-like acyl-CoA transferase